MARALRVAFIVNEFPCISETFILNQITGLLELGHDVRIFAYKNGSSAQRIHDDVAKFKLLDRAKYFPPIPKGRAVRLGKFLCILLRQIFRSPVYLLKCFSLRRYGIYEFLNRLFLCEPLLSENFDIIHCQYGIIGKDWIFLKDITNSKIVTSFRGYDLTQFLQENPASAYEELFRKGDAFFPVCDYFARRLEELGCPKGRIFVHRSGIDTSKFYFQERRMDGKEIRIFTVGRLVEKKGLQYSIKAVAKLVNQYPAIQYVIAGEGPLRRELENLIQVLGMEKHIHLAGPLTSEEVQELMNKAHIFVLASVTAKNGDQEGTPVSLQEAMATGLPVVSTYHSGIPELVADGKSGFLVAEKDIENLAGKCGYLVSHPQLCVEMGRAGRKFVEQNFEISKLNQKLAEIYKKSMNNLAGQADGA